ncbi:MAG: Nif3-like dinuclear metal center hexameric protein [Muribaculum sp.]|nr:Nif3-like dinuclear metal center hexameric protein [Muribaculum sp.]
MQIAEAIEQYAPLALQEPWDNSGWQLGSPEAVCSGAMICVDATEEVVDEAVAVGANLIVTHHPLIFHPLKQILPASGRVAATVAKALKAGVSIYSAHTSADNAANGVSWQIADRLGIKDVRPLVPGATPGSGTGAIGVLPEPVSPERFAELVKSRIGSPVARCSNPTNAPQTISSVALCGGSGSEFIPAAIASGAQAYVTSDTRHNVFIDYPGRIFLVDIGHYESEKCTKQIFYHILTQKFPNFAAHISQSEINPIVYL